jgi:hypothetical protein
MTPEGPLNRNVGQSGNSQKPNSTSVTLNAFSRVTASVGLMLLFGFGGSWLDRWLNVGFLTILGFLIGGVLMLVGMLYAVKAAEHERRLLKENRGASGDMDE